MYKQLKSFIIETMKLKDLPKLSFLRYLDANIQNSAIQRKLPIDNSIVIDSLKSDLKKLNDELAYIKDLDLINTKNQHVFIINSILPKTYSEEVTEEKIKKIIEGLGLVSIKDMGKVMAEVKKDSSFDLKMSSVIIKKLLT
jgi:uncharacterized protein